MFTRGILRLRGYAAIAVAVAFVAHVAIAETKPEKALPDSTISLAVDLALAQEPGVSAHLIDVETKDGVVMLAGTVDSLLAKERATRVAESVRGVRSVVNRVEVEPVAQSDAEIKSQVMFALARDPTTDAYDVAVDVDDGVVTLTGSVASWAEKKLAGTVAKRVRGISDVENDITIEYETSREDSEIRSDIIQRLRWSLWIEPEFINVEVERGKVSLEGSVSGAAEKTQLLQLAHVAGVDAVDGSKLRVRDFRDQMRRKRKQVQRPDAKIKAAVEDAFLYDPRVVSFEPEVDVNDGIVTLSGEVGDLMAKKAAEKDAVNTRGVKRVKNYLKVRPAKRPDDLTITQNVNEALEWNPTVDRFDISVFTLNGKVYLTGKVDSRFAKALAEDVASGVKGVIDVSNNLVVTPDWELKSDPVLEADIENAIAWNMTLIDEEIDVSVEDGIATISGTVDNLVEYHAAEGEAYDAGARVVRNRLKVSI